MSGSISGLDGKTYPSAWLPADDRAALVEIVHQRHSAEGLSVRKTLTQVDGDCHPATEVSSDGGDKRPRSRLTKVTKVSTSTGGAA